MKNPIKAFKNDPLVMSFGLVIFVVTTAHVVALYF